MAEIYDLGKARADEFERLIKRKADLEQLIHCCLVTNNSILNILEFKRMEFSKMVDTYRSDWQKELDGIKFKLGKK